MSRLSGSQFAPVTAGGPLFLFSFDRDPSLSLIAACDRHFLFTVPIVFSSLFLARFRGSSVDRVSSMRTERGPVWVGSCFGDQQRHQQPPPSEHRRHRHHHHRHPGRAPPPLPSRSPPPFGNFSFLSLFISAPPRDSHSRNAPRSGDLFVRDEPGAGGGEKKRNFESRALEIGRACIDINGLRRRPLPLGSLLSKTQRDFPSGCGDSSVALDPCHRDRAYRSDRTNFGLKKEA